MAIDPDPVSENEVVTIAVEMPGGDPQDWEMRIVAAHDPAAIKRAPRGLDAYGSPVEGRPGAYECKISTIGFEPGEYLVDMAPGGRFDEPGMASKKFTVRPQEIIAVSAGKRYPEDYGMPGSRYGRI